MRLDIYLVEKSLLPSREKAKEWIKSKKVFVNSLPAKKPSQNISEKDFVTITEKLKFVSRAGYKLEKAILDFDIDCRNKICLDLGSSTGGFVDCLIQNKAKKVYALEISTGELAKKLAKEPKVINMEGVDVRSDFVLPEKVDIISADCTFLSLKDILPICKKWLKKDGVILALIKPPFEVSRSEGKMKVNSGYIEILEDLKEFAKQNQWQVLDVSESPLLGKVAGQKEFLMKIKK